MTRARQVPTKNSDSGLAVTTKSGLFDWWSKDPKHMGKRVLVGISILWVFACLVFVANNISSRVVPQNGNVSYYFGPLFPPGIVAGHDFWIAYTYTDVLRRGFNYKNLPGDVPEKVKPYFGVEGGKNVAAYPPLAFMLYVPYLLLSYPDAYTVQRGLLFCANLFVIVLAVRMAGKIWEGMGPREGQKIALFPHAIMAAMCFIAVSSYGYFFSIERGNCDILSMAFAWMFLYCLIEKPKQLWLQTLLLACAIHIKVTPAVLVPLLFWRHRWKCIVPLAVVNVCLLLVWGPGNAKLFLQGLSGFAAAPDGWWGDHSAYSFAFCVLKPLGFEVIAAERALMALSLVIWGIGAVVLWRRGLAPVNLLLLFLISVPVMNILPNCSNDYKLVILYGPLAVIMLGLLYAYAYEGSRWALCGVLLEFFILYWLTKSGGLAGAPFWANKFPMVLLTQCLTLFVIVHPFGVFKGSGVRSESSGQS